ncbi:CPBP family intramembrane glutamic endopeptidase [Lactobacillus sp. wkB10]|uniref:CPBP family intramembrane glutamic endopeptidase n=1 Tax=Lactobacillus sp. wkB10 TaxID=1545701 RepID=UPI000513112E|nr:CPBP family intramembrane glutamic endopeptidase [Lactobacillus sp. wkB10]KGG54902.1 hypothetical protein LACWKB10_0459 [Lactobacillus sp. wkB10]
MKCLNQNAETAGSLKTNKTIRIFHLAQTVGQLGILVICFYFGLRNAKLFAPKECNTILSSFILVCFFILVCLQFSLLQTEAEKPNGPQLFNHYFETITICCTLPQCLALLTKLLNYYHLINGTFWMLLVIFYSFIMYIPMAKLALIRVNNNWGRILLFAFIIYRHMIWPAKTIAGHLLYNKCFMQINNSGVLGIPILISITYFVMSSWKIQKPHKVFSRNCSISFSSVITLFLFGNLCWKAQPILNSVINHTNTSSLYFSRINPVIICSALRAGIAEEWLMRFIIIALLAQIFRSNKDGIYLIVLIDGLIFGLWHITNVCSQTLSVTINQIIHATGWGFLYAAIYLYTHSILLTMIHHSLYDFINFLFQSSITKYSAHVGFSLQFSIDSCIVAYMFLCAGLAFIIIRYDEVKQKNVIAKNLTQI